jgi:hypothetical protein
MKTRLFLAGLAIFGIFALQAQRTVHAGGFNNHYNNDYADEPIAFEERNIMFYVFLDGEFDFNTEPTVYVDYVSRRGNAHAKVKKGIRIERDAYGKIRRIGNVFISYTYDGKVKKIGSVYITYYRDRMESIGNLDIVYSRYGVEFFGDVKGYSYHNSPYYSSNWDSFNNDNCVTWEYGYFDTFFTSHDFHNNYENFNEDNDFYYYRTKNTGNKEPQIIKQKKENKSSPKETRRKL